MLRLERDGALSRGRRTIGASGGPRLAAVADGAVILLSAFALVLLMNLGRELPFGSTADGPIYFLPLIKAHTDAWLGGHFLNIDWRLGCGWTPWEGVQAGVFYPPYLAANLLARLIGQPLAILDVSAALHLALAGLLVYVLTAGRLERGRRVLWSLLAIVQPAPIAIGMNWHNYLASYPWFVGLLLLLWRVARGYSAWTAANRLLLALLFAALCLPSHPQMFVIGTALLFCWRLVLGHDRNSLRDFLAMGAALAPLAVPLLFVYQQSRLASPDWFAPRSDKTFLLSHAQSLNTWLVGLSIGNLIPSRLFRVWPGVSWTGIGMFFCPLLILSVATAIRRRQWTWIVIVAGLGAALGVQSFPWLTWFCVGPFAGFRWTWKLSIFAAALALAMALAQSETSRAGWRMHAWALTVLIGVSALVAFRTLPFDLLPAATSRPGSGVAATHRETLAMMRAWGIRPGARIAWIGRRSIHAVAMAAPLLGLMGNAPLLVGLQTVHQYEPLENRFAAAAHDNYSTPWRVILDSEDYADDRDRHDRRFRELGVNWLLSTSPQAFPADRRRTYRDAYGQVVHGVWLPPLQEGLSFPWGIADNGRRVELLAEPGGALRTAEPLAAPPGVPVGRDLVWRRMPSGHWRGVFRALGAGWVIAELLALALTACWLSSRWRWERTWT